jgi:hypothetical protein
VARGDVMQFLKAKFRSKDGRSWSSAGDPDHTAVVTEVEREWGAQGCGAEFRGCEEGCPGGI